MTDTKSKLRDIPSIDRLINQARQHKYLAQFASPLVAAAVRTVVNNLRQRLLANEDVDLAEDAVFTLAQAELQRQLAPQLRRVINATGVILHTNLGRAPLSDRAGQAVAAALQGYSNLEYDLVSGARGSRYDHVAARICALTGAEAALVVNNNAAAVLMVLAALARDREVIVSRGQLVEIGGSFRIPDVLRQSGATLVEVGTTNKTHLRDYAQAIGPQTAMILKVHTSNYRIIGFTAEPAAPDLAKLAHDNDLPLVDDLGSGTLLPITVGGWQEPTVRERVAAGADIVTFSGDKLFGGSQAGIIVGRTKYIAVMQQHPLLRAVRLDKLSLAALEGTLLDYSLGEAAVTVPVQRMLHITPSELQHQAAALAASLDFLKEAGWRVSVIEVVSQAGGGSLPGVDLPGYGVSLKHEQYNLMEVEQLLRHSLVPIIVRIHNDQIVIDVRCLKPQDYDDIVAAWRVIVKGDPDCAT